MSCEMRSTMTRYRAGSSIRIPPMFTNSADTPGAPIALIRSTNAGGKDSSIPNNTPITPAILQVPSLPAGPWALRYVRRYHFLPLRPIVLGSVAPDVQAVRNALVVQQLRRLFGVSPANVPFAGDQHPLVLAEPVQKPRVVQTRKEMRRR